ncbi:hypothetical protein [Flavobacterium rhizosphaerae]|uniref:Lipoprotein n=1 Tax=Flavobacterium rhizosphaerae TaxID=3163298 RepID=A0ABW8YT26_9FLAO
MKTYNRFLLIFILCIVFISLTSCKLGRFAYYNFANITDYKIFPYRTAKNDSVQFTFITPEKPKSPKTITVSNKEMPFETYLAENKTVAFLVIKNDTLLYENYFNGYDEESIVASFSMAKSILQYCLVAQLQMDIYNLLTNL